MTNVKKVKGLIAVNVVLLILLAVVTWSPNATAKNGINYNNAGDYIMVGGTLNGSTSNAVYILDQRSSILIGLLYDRSSKRMKGIQVRSLNQDAKAAGADR